MSYCRVGNDSDVYVYHSVRDMYFCWLRSSSDGHEGSFRCKTTSEMLAHLEAHVAAGHKVPLRAIERLKKEAKELRMNKTETKELWVTSIAIVIVFTLGYKTIIDLPGWVCIFLALGVGRAASVLWRVIVSRRME